MEFLVSIIIATEMSASCLLSYFIADGATSNAVIIGYFLSASSPSTIVRYDKQ